MLVSSHTWDGQNYASDELAMAIAQAKSLKTRIVPLWVEEIPPERRPYGIVTSVGLSLPAHRDCLECVASKLVETVLRLRAADTEQLWLAQLSTDMPSSVTDGLSMDVRMPRVDTDDRSEVRRQRMP